MEKTITFDRITFDLEPINTLVPANEQPEENYIQYTQKLLFSTYKCSKCGKEQLVLINPDTHKPYGNPRCYNKDCSSYGYSRDYKSLFEKETKVADRREIKFGNYENLIFVGYLDDKNILCITTGQFRLFILNEEVAEVFNKDTNPHLSL